MNRIIEAFTRPHYQITAIDELIQTIVAILAFLVVFGIVFSIMLWLTKRP